MPAQTIAEFFATPIPAKLWHYTSVDALESILFTQKIWATEAHRRRIDLSLTRDDLC